jgi:hypothetical protein
VAANIDARPCPHAFNGLLRVRDVGALLSAGMVYQTVGAHGLCPADGGSVVVDLNVCPRVAIRIWSDGALDERHSKMEAT